MEAPSIVARRCRSFGRRSAGWSAAAALGLLVGVPVGEARAAIETPPYMYLDTDAPTTGLYIHWRGGQGTVHYGIDDYEENTISGDGEVHLQCLVPGARYKWYLDSEGDTSELGSFRLDPGPGESFKLAAIADPHLEVDGGQAKFEGTVETFEWLRNEHPDIDLLVTLGDVGHHGLLEEQLLLFEAGPEVFANAIVLPAPGNHDVGYDTLDPQAHAAWTSLYPHLPATCFEDQPCDLQTGVNYFADYGNVTFASTLRRAEGGFFENEWWKGKLDEKVDADTLRPLLIPISHIHGNAGGITVDDARESRGVLWMSGHAHTWDLDFSPTWGQAVVNRVINQHVAVVEIDGDGNVYFDVYDGASPSESFHVDGTAHVTAFGPSVELPADDCPPTDPGDESGDGDPTGAAEGPGADGEPLPEPDGSGSGSASAGEGEPGTSSGGTGATTGSGMDPGSADGGLGCRVAGGSPPWMLGFFALGVLGWRRRRAGQSGPRGLGPFASNVVNRSSREQSARARDQG